MLTWLTALSLKAALGAALLLPIWTFGCLLADITFQRSDWKRH